MEKSPPFVGKESTLKSFGCKRKNGMVGFVRKNNGENVKVKS